MLILACSAARFVVTSSAPYGAALRSYHPDGFRLRRIRMCNCFVSYPPHREECLVEEALPLSNRVVVFSPGPADVIADFPVELDRPDDT